MRTRIKICGITRTEDAHAAASAGVDALGFMFFKESKRYISPESAGPIVRSLPPLVEPVAVFVNESAEEIRRICAECNIRTIQLHGEESPEFCRSLSTLRIIKAFRIRERLDLAGLPEFRTSAWLLDSFSAAQRGGTGEKFDWELASSAMVHHVPVFLAGGLNAANISAAIRQVRPYAVDLSSGVEVSPGIKDHAKIRELVRAAREADASI